MIQQRWMGLIGWLVVLVATAAAQDATQNAQQNTPPRNNGTAQAPAPAADALTDAQRIARLRQTIDETRAELDKLQAQLANPESEYAKAEAAFLKLDQELTEKQRALQALQDQPEEQPEEEQLAAELEELRKRWQLARDRFDLAISERGTVNQRIATLRQKLQSDEASLARLTGPLATQPATQPATTQAAPTETPAPAITQPAPVATPPPAEAQPEKPAAPSVLPGMPIPTPDANAAAPAKAEKAPSPELEKAREEAAAAEAKAEEAKQEVASIEERIAVEQAAIAQARELRETAEKQAENARQTVSTLNEQLEQLQVRINDTPDRAARSELLRERASLLKQREDARARETAALAKERAAQAQIEAASERLDDLQAERIRSLAEAAEKEREAEEAGKRVAEFENPFSPANLQRWLIERGPKIIAIIVGVVVLLWLTRIASRRIVSLVVSRAGDERAVERENRVQTLEQVFHNASYLVIIAVGLLMLLPQIGVDVVPLVGGAAVVGLAVAFGAQNLVRDFFTGFMILLENQYGVNDVVKLGDTAGLVERITLRITVLRGLDGTVHFVPNGQITTVSNMTHGWSRALFDIGVAYKEDVDRVMKILVELGKEIREDLAFRHLILDDPEMLGVDAFADSAIVVRFFIKTKPLQQWTVKRAMLRRIKKRFDAEGIEIPFPHRTVFHRYEDGPPPEFFHSGAAAKE